MAKNTLYVGLDVHAATISVAVAEAGRHGAVRSLGKIPNELGALRKMLSKLGDPKRLRVAYEAGPCGFALYWHLTRLGVDCIVVAPSLLPVKAGDRVKTDRRDAEKLARVLRSGEATAVWIPDRAHEALRDLVRAREAAKKDEMRVRNRLTKFLLRYDRRSPKGTTNWSAKHLAWLEVQRFEEPCAQVTFQDALDEVNHASQRIERLEHYLDAAIEKLPAHLREVVDALQGLRGVAKLTALTVVAEVGQLSRFAKPTLLMGYSGLVPSEYSSGGDTRRGRITKSGNAHLRRILAQAAWSYRLRPAVSKTMRARQKLLPPQVNEIAQKAMHRLHKRYWAMLARGKPATVAATAVARELLGFIWAIGVSVERKQQAAKRA